MTNEQKLGEAWRIIESTRQDMRAPDKDNRHLGFAQSLINDVLASMAAPLAEQEEEEPDMDDGFPVELEYPGDAS